MRKIFFLFLFLPVLASAQQRGFDISSMQKPGIASLQASPTTISNLNGTNGSAGTPQTVTVTFSNSTITCNAPTNTEISQDGGGSWNSQQIFSTGSPLALLIRTTNTAPVGSISGNLTMTGTNNVTPVTIPVSGTVSAAGTYYTIIVDHTKVPNTDLDSFPLLIKGTYSNLKDVAHGGTITDRNNFLFSNDNAGTSLLKWEIESWDSTTGAIVAHVLIPTLSHTTDRTLYLPFGALGYGSFQGGAPGSVWDSKYLLVYHSATGAIGKDWTANAFNGTVNLVSAATGQADGAGSYASGSPSFINVGNHAGTTGDLTLEYVGNPSNFSFDHYILSKGNPLPQPYIWTLDGSTGKADLYMGDGSNFSNFVATVAPTSGSFNYLAVTRTGQNVVHYLNGNTNGSGTFGSSITPTNGTNNLYVGVKENATNAMDGIIDEIRISNVVRSPDRVKTFYNNWFSTSTFYSIF